MFSFRDSHTTVERSKSVATGSTVPAEGVVLVGVLEGGVEKVKPATGAASEKVVGFSKLDNESLTFNVKVESVQVPAVSPYVVKLTHGSIAGTGPSTYDVRVQPATGSDYVQDGSGGHPITLEFKVSDAAGGELTFHSSNAGVVLKVYYKYNLTALEASQIVPGVRSVNNTASAILNACVAMGGTGEIYTKEYDVTKDYSTGTLKTLAGGKLTIGGSGTDVSALMRVIKLPDATDAHLGVAINVAI